eukprot:TRINITY_DN9813_c0_g1_i1.p1 TRINITY_DN9813_c0_g1~~TRINITY_DN9813_c0_g1_i1.p1  ORF type:complete len:327 (+),score=72.95 TRINITY_DN9813_c0_g1_i1:11-991(+)
MIRRPPRSTQSRSSAASDVYKRQIFKKSGDVKDGHRNLIEELKTMTSLNFLAKNSSIFNQVFKDSKVIKDIIMWSYKSEEFNNPKDLQILSSPLFLHEVAFSELLSAIQGECLCVPREYEPNASTITYALESKDPKGQEWELVVVLINKQLKTCERFYPLACNLIYEVTLDDYLPAKTFQQLSDEGLHQKEVDFGGRTVLLLRHEILVSMNKAALKRLAKSRVNSIITNLPKEIDSDPKSSFFKKFHLPSSKVFNTIPLLILDPASFETLHALIETKKKEFYHYTIDYYRQKAYFPVNFFIFNGGRKHTVYICLGFIQCERKCGNL